MSQTTAGNGQYFLLVALIVLLAGFGYFAYQTYDLTNALKAEQAMNATITNEMASTSAALSLAQTEVTSLAQTLHDIGEELEEALDELREEQNRNEEFEDQIRAITGTVRDLDKLAKTDEELLQKYSKVYFLNENYVPSKIRQIDNDFVLAGKDIQYFHADALPFLEDMLADADDDGIDLKVVSAYRSFDHQTALKGEFTTVYGSGANTFSADQGYSEHQLGTTVDLTDPATGGTFTSFAQTETYQWLLDNAHKYGFTLSYPENNTFYVFEPWHWRFVGTDLASDLNRADAHFYDWDQRKIDSYLINIFD